MMKRSSPLPPSSSSSSDSCWRTRWTLLLMVSFIVLILLAIIILAVCMGNLSDLVHERSLAVDKHIDELRERVEELEAENDYLMEEKQSQQKYLMVSEKVLNVEPSLLPHFCLLEMDRGPCGARIDRWFYDDRTKDCLKFTWSGCRGNENNFLSLNQCRAACQVDLSKPWIENEEIRPITSSSSSLPPTSSTPSSLRSIGQEYKDQLSPSICSLPPDSGPCPEQLQRFYFANGRCFPFEYGGCGGNQNNFYTERDCFEVCLSRSGGHLRTARRGDRADIPVLRQDHLCLLPVDHGTTANCTATRASKRFFFNAISGQCEEFDYTGCGGNRNNFANSRKCQIRCRF